MTIDFETFGSWIPIFLFFITVLGGVWKIANGLEKSISALNYEIKNMTDFMTDSKVDRKELHGRIDDVYDIINKQETRITVLEKHEKGHYRGRSD